MDTGELDLPPAPPPLEGFEDPASKDFPEITGAEFPENIPDMSPGLNEDLSKIRVPDMEDLEGSSKYQEPEFAELPSIDDIQSAPEIRPVFPAYNPPPLNATLSRSNPLPPNPPSRPIQRLAEIESFSKPTARIFSRQLPSREQGSRAIYVKVNNFKMTLGSINVLRRDLKKAEEGLTKLENLKLSKDKSFDALNSSLYDLQKKLIFVDRTLFKGEKK